MDEHGVEVPGYDLLERLGAGASGEVWRAQRRADGLVVALKVLHPGDGGLGQALREAGVLSRVHHPHLLHLYDVVPLPRAGDAGGLALAVQLASGGSLAQVLTARGLLTVGELITVLAPVAGALAHLHAAGVVHGDVSPGNVLFLEDGMPMLGDVGVARIMGEPPGPLHGTDGMVAPEVLEGFTPGPEADVYALGALAWLALTGDRPGWVGTREDLEELAPHLSEAVRELVLDLLAPEPEDRPEAQEVATGVFELGRAAPVQTAPRADASTDLTRRLRAAVEADRYDDDGSPGVATHRCGRGRLHGGRVRPEAVRTRPRWLYAVVTVLAVATALAGVLGWGRALSWGDAPGQLAGQGATRAAGTGQAAESTKAGRAAGSTATGQEVGPAGSGASQGDPVEPEGGPLAPEPAVPVGDPPVGPQPGTDPVGLLQGLLDARARAWTAGDEGLLRHALVPGSPAWDDDTGDLRRAAAQGVRYRDLAFDVGSAATLGNPAPAPGPADGPGEGADGEDHDGVPVVVAMVVATSDLVVTTPTGTQRVPGAREEVQVELRDVAGRWRVWSWVATDLP